MKVIGMISKIELEQAVKDSNTEVLEKELKNHPGLIRKVQRLLYHADEDVRWGAARTFGLAAEIFETEKMKDLIRQLVWMINEESGNNCWFAPQALGEIGRVKPELVEDFVECLKEFHKYPDSKIREGLDYAFKLFREAGLEITV